MVKSVASILAVSAVAVSAPVLAQPATANMLQIGLGFRYGFEMEDGDFNPWGPGIGVAGGYTLGNGVYLGGNFDYFFGDSIGEAPNELSANIWQLMAEGGYDLGLGEAFVVRPKLGVGFATTNMETCIDLGLGTGEQCASDSETDFAIAPGATFLYIGQSFSLSLDLRYDMIFAEGETQNALLFSAGIGF